MKLKDELLNYVLVFLGFVFIVAIFAVMGMLIYGA